MVMQSDPVKAANRELVKTSFEAAKALNNKRFISGDPYATSEYIYSNQGNDSAKIVNEFHQNQKRVISIVKKTKVGMDGLIIKLAVDMTTHNDDTFVVDPDNVRIITGMSNIMWERDMKDKAPSCFRDNIFHHGQLQNANMSNLKNGLVIIDEIDTGNNEEQVLHTTLRNSGILDIKHMIENNNRFIFASATMLRELYQLFRWGDLHKDYRMEIPKQYIGHIDFYNLGILQEFYPLSTSTNIEKWIQTDILSYKNDYRVHIARVTEKEANLLRNGCIANGIDFYNHTSAERISDMEIHRIFDEALTNHVVLAIKGFYRRANLIPNKWKLRIGATMERHVKNVDTNVQIQGLPGRMTGYWREIVEGGFRTGPHRTSIDSVLEYERTYNDPWGPNDYASAKFSKKAGKVKKNVPSLLAAENIPNLESVALPVVNEEESIPEVIDVTKEEYDTIQKIGKEWNWETIKPLINKYKPGYIETLPERRFGILEPRNTRKVIEQFLNANEKRERYNWDAYREESEWEFKDSYRIFLDHIGYKIIVSVYLGSKKLKQS